MDLELGRGTPEKVIPSTRRRPALVGPSGSHPPSHLAKPWVFIRLALPSDDPIPTTTVHSGGTIDGQPRGETMPLNSFYFLI